MSNLGTILEMVRFFAPPETPRELLNGICKALVDCNRLGMKLDQSLDVERGHHIVSICVFPESINEKGEVESKIWLGVRHTGNMRVERIEAVTLRILEIYLDQRRAAIAYARWAIKAGAIEKKVDASLPIDGEATGPLDPDSLN